MTDRRKFLKMGAAGAGAASLPGSVFAAAAQGAAQGTTIDDTLPRTPEMDMTLLGRAGRPLDILVLGGTGFIGPHQIRHALARGHRITTFNRGNRAGLFGDQVEELTGNRDERVDGGLAALGTDRRWDVVIDNSGYVPRHVRDSASLLRGRCRRYIYISTASVYDFEAASEFAEDATLAAAPAADVEEISNETYGPLKAECDRAVREILGEAATVIRPGYIVGPGDRTDRFTYWVERVHRGGDIVAPGGAQRSIQWVDARDLAQFVGDCAENDTRGIFNLAGPAAPITRLGLLWGLAATTSEPVRFHWPEDALLDELGLSFPMLGTGDYSFWFDNGASLRASARYRPLARTADDTLEWWLEQPAERRARARGWPSPELEARALARLGVA